MNPTGVLQKLDELIQSRSILRHPFYVRWQHAELTREQLATYASVYYPHVAAFPSYLEAAAARAEDPVIFAELERNLADERGEPKAHHDLWLDFAEELGVDRLAVKSAAPHPAAAAMVSVFGRLSQQDIASALAALYSYESQQPDVSRQKAQDLRRHYGVQSPKALAYFDVHATTDVHHRRGEREALARCLRNGTSVSILGPAREALHAYWELLDGICEATGILTTS